MEYSEDHCNCPICDEINDRGTEVECKHFLTAINTDDHWGHSYCLEDESWEAFEGLLEEIDCALDGNLQCSTCNEDEGVQIVFEVFSAGEPASNIWLHLGAVTEQPGGIIYGSGISWYTSTFYFHGDPSTAYKQLNELYSKVIGFLKADTREKLLALIASTDKDTDKLTELVQRIEQLDVDLTKT